MKLDPSISRRIKNHLNEIDVHLHHLPQAEQKEVLRLVYNHILNAFANQPKPLQNIQTLESILAEMDPPRSYIGKSIASLTTQGTRISPEEKNHAPIPAKRQNRTLISLIALGLLLLLAWGTLKIITNQKHHPDQSSEFHISTLFVDDTNILGQWVFADNTNLPAYFEIYENEKEKSNPPFKEITFQPHGKTEYPQIGWTRALVLQSKNRTANRYSLKKISGIDYMLLEWQNKNQNPCYYGFRKVGPTDNAIITEGVGWGDYTIGSTREKLTEALAPIVDKQEYGCLRGERIDCIDAIIGSDGLCREIRFNIGFSGTTTKGLRIGSTLKKARNIYGTPCDTGKKGMLATLDWPAQGIQVWARHERIIQIIITAPKAEKIDAL